METHSKSTAKDKSAEVEFVQNVYGNVSIVKESLKNVSENAGSLKWKVVVPAGGEANLTYTLRVSEN